MTPSSVLFVRSVPPPAALAALRWIAGQLPGASITVLTSDGGRRALEPAGLVAEFERYDAPRVSVGLAGAALIRRLAARHFDLVIVPYAGSRSDYWNVARFALALRGRSTVWLDCARAQVGGGTGDVLVRVSLADWWREARSVFRVRLAVLAAIKWAALLAGYVVAVVALSTLALFLLPLVWLKPGPARPE